MAAAHTDTDDALHSALERFTKVSGFSERGAIVTDLDGTAVHEMDGKIVIPQRVELALMALVKAGHPLMLNTLRFPLSVIRTFGREWYSVTGAALPAVTLNGSLLGNIVETREGELGFEELACFPLTASEIDQALEPVIKLLEQGVRDVLVFYYPRDWRIGEVIWTPVAEKVIPIKEKYRSASAVSAVELPKLRAQLAEEDICMIFLLIDLPRDRLMAYQHTSSSSFYTHAGIDKLASAYTMANMLASDLKASVGAGDTNMDRFLEGVGCAIIVGERELAFNGVYETLRVPNSPKLGDLLFRLVELERSLHT